MSGNTSEGRRTETRTGDPMVVREVFEEMPIGLASTIGPRHVYVAVNSAFYTVVRRTDLVGRALPDAFPEVASQHIIGMVDGVFTTGETQIGREWRVHLDRGPDGAPEELYTDFTVTARRDGTGEIIGLLISATDVTERVRQRMAMEQETAATERRYRAAREVVANLQEALLPASLPVLPAVGVAARYLVAAQDQSAGGDWFDALPLEDGRVALIVGDVVGHGVTASAAMGQLRAVLGELIADRGDLERTLVRLDRMASRNPAMRAATVCAAVLDPVTGRLEYCTYGHPPPLVVGLDGTAHFLPPTGTGPLGTRSAPHIETVTIPVGDVLVMYSDGLIERPARTLQEGMDRLATVAGDSVSHRIMPATAATSVVDRVSQQSVELLTRDGYEDDVTVLAVQRRPAPVAPLHLDLPAEPASFAEARRRLLEWLEQLRPDPHDEAVLDLAVTELIANVIEHAYAPGGRGPVGLTVDLGGDGVVRLEMADRGAWQEPAVPPPSTSGRGLWMVGAVVDDLTIDHDGHPGTVVTAGLRLRRPVTMTAGPTHEAARRPVPFAARLEEGPPRRLRVTGPLDAASAEAFAEHLAVASRGGIAPVVVDLTGVDVLSSAGVSALLTARDHHGTHHRELPVIATAGGVPSQVLDLVGMDHTRS